jgi:hypothetical protein
MIARQRDDLLAMTLSYGQVLNLILSEPTLKSCCDAFIPPQLANPAFDRNLPVTGDAQKQFIRFDKATPGRRA